MSVGCGSVWGVAILVFNLKFSQSLPPLLPKTRNTSGLHEMNCCRAEQQSTHSSQIKEHIYHGIWKSLLHFYIYCMMRKLAEKWLNFIPCMQWCCCQIWPRCACILMAGQVYTGSCSNISSYMPASNFHGNEIYAWHMYINLEHCNFLGLACLDFLNHYSEALPLSFH